MFAQFLACACEAPCNCGREAGLFAMIGVMIAGIIFMAVDFMNRRS